VVVKVKEFGIAGVMGGPLGTLLQSD